jgi:hypothetical protein
VIQRPNNFQTPATRTENVKRTQAAQDPLQANRRCFACGENGHFANRCPNSRPHADQLATATPALPVEPTPFLLPPSKTMLEEESTMSLWRKPQMLSWVCFSSMPLLQLYYLILGQRILSYLLHMLKSIIYP